MSRHPIEKISGRTFTYDVSINRLTSAQTAATDYTADSPNRNTKLGQPLCRTMTPGETYSVTSQEPNAVPDNVGLNVNAKNQLITETDPASKATIGTNTFDAAGNLANDGSYSYNYDAENRITGANGFTYTYDAAGNRVKKSNGTTGTLYWYASVGVIAETDLAGNSPKEYVFFNGNRIARRDPAGQVFYYFSDHLKTTSVINDATGNDQIRVGLRSLGRQSVALSTTSTTLTKFTGKERDGETGLDYFGPAITQASWVAS